MRDQGLVHIYKLSCGHEYWRPIGEEDPVAIGEKKPCAACSLAWWPKQLGRRAVRTWRVLVGWCRGTL